MKTIIYYFTGTGNSLAAAKKIAAALGETELVPIASLASTAGDIAPAAERVGIICPVYFSGLPAMAALFAERLDLKNAQYVFSVVTFGGSGDSSALQQLDAIVKKRSGRGLDYGSGLKMPGNYVLMYEPPAGAKRDRILAAANRQLETIATEIGECRRRTPRRSFLQQAVFSLLYPRFASHVHGDDRKFSVTDACTSCGTCVAVCPAGNIRLVDKRPAFSHRCELCCACIHLCPAHAIQAGRGTQKRQRYRNPGVAVAELRLRKAGEQE